MDTTQEELEEFFEKFGEVQSLKQAKGKNDEFLGFGFVSFKSAEGAVKAKAEAQNLLFKG